MISSGGGVTNMSEGFEVPRLSVMQSSKIKNNSEVDETIKLLNTRF